MTPDDRPAAAEPTAAPAPALQYDTRPAGITRRQMNVFLLLLFINTLLFAGFVCLPGASPWLKQTWADFQARRAEKKKKAAEAANIAAALKDCLTHTMPPDKVVYAEAPPDVAKLLASDGRTWSLDNTPQIRTPEGHGVSDEEENRVFANLVWQPPAMTRLAPALGALHDALPRENRVNFPNNGATVLLHEMKTPAGQRRLVAVNLWAEQVVIAARFRESRVSRARYDLETRRTLSAYVFDAQNPRWPVATVLVLSDSREIPAPPPASESQSPDPQAKRSVRPGPQWKVFAGQVDPKDPTRLTIRYEIDGKPGVIDGRLNDGDRLMLTPRTGMLTAWTSGSEYTWDISAAAIPASATQPASTRPSAASAPP